MADTPDVIKEKQESKKLTVQISQKKARLQKINKEIEDAKKELAEAKTVTDQVVAEKRLEDEKKIIALGREISLLEGKRNTLKDVINETVREAVKAERDEVNKLRSSIIAEKDKIAADRQALDVTKKKIADLESKTAGLNDRLAKSIEKNEAKATAILAEREETRRLFEEHTKSVQEYKVKNDEMTRLIDDARNKKKVVEAQADLLEKRERKVVDIESGIAKDKENIKKSLDEVQEKSSELSKKMSEYDEKLKGVEAKERALLNEELRFKERVRKHNLAER